MTLSTGNAALSPNRRLARLLCDAPLTHVSALMPAPVVSASTASRTISGMVVPYGRYGNTSAGRLAVRAGAVRLPSDLSRVKLVDQHQRPPVAVGYATAAESRADGLYMTFQLGTTAAADQVLLEAAERTRDGLSVELDDLTVDASSTVTDGLLTAVAAVAIPAFTDARVTNLAASNQGENMDCITCGQRHPVTAACAPAALVASQTAPEPAQPAAPAQQPAPQQPAPATSPAPAPAQPAPAQPVQQPAPATTEPVQQPAAAPAMMANLATSGSTMQGAAHDSEVYAALARVARGESRNPALEAALADIVNTSVYQAVTQDSYVGRLWAGNTYRRRFVPLLRHGNLTSWKVKGWRWGVAPEVADYAGDKANVPSNAPTVVPAETTAARLAGGHDLDRKFRDFGDTEFLQAYFEAMTESYAKKSDGKALAFILAQAALNTAVATTAGANLIQAAVTAENALVDAFDDDGVEADYVLVNRSDRMKLLTVTNNAAPAYAEALGFDFSKMIGTNSVAAGTVVAGVKGAGTFYELGETPIRVEALDIARGGVDEAVFGYYATLQHDVRGFQRVTITP